MGKEYDDYQKLRDRLHTLDMIYLEEEEIPPEVQKIMDSLERRIEELESHPQVREKLEERRVHYREVAKKEMKKFLKISEQCAKEKPSPLGKLYCVVRRLQKEKQKKPK